MMHRKFLALLALLLCLALSVPALAAEGLAAFQNPQNAQPGAFSDVPSGSWYAAGVQAVSSRGIMNGTGKTSFSPKQTVSWAQAVAIAARIHAACNDGEIAETGGGAIYRLCHGSEAPALHVPGRKCRHGEDHHPAGAGGSVCKRAARRGSARDQRPDYPGSERRGCGVPRGGAENVRRGRFHRQKRRKF